MFLGGTPADPGPPAAVASDDGWNWHVTSRGLEFTPLEGVNLRLSGRAHYDIAQFDPDRTEIPDEHGFRRLRLALGGDVKEDWSFFLENDVGGSTKGWKDVWLRYKGVPRLELTAGNQIAPFSMDELTSSDDGFFVERALPNALSAGYYTGLAVRTWGDQWMSSAGIFGNALDNEPKKHSRGQSFDARSIYTPIRTEDAVLHLGASYEYRDVDSGTDYRIRTRPEVGITDVRLIDTRDIRDVNSTQTYGLESAAMYGPFVTQGEYIWSDLERDLVDVRFSGWYAQAACVLTGEHHSYSGRSGRFGSVEPSSAWGAFELAARWSGLDLRDTDVHGGKEENATFGLNWYVNSYVRVMADYILIHADPNRRGDEERPEAFVLRLQVGF